MAFRRKVISLSVEPPRKMLDLAGEFINDLVPPTRRLTVRGCSAAMA
jgi:hypothetical protein